MRNVRIRKVDGDILVLEVNRENTGLVFTAGEMNAMVDDLLSLPVYARNSREDIIAHLVEKTLDRSSTPLSEEETRKAVRLIVQECHRR
jgi:hypothetical protein